MLCELLHHGVAATSSPKVIACIPRPSCIDDETDNDATTNSDLVYASHLMLNVARPRQIPITITNGNDSSSCDERATMERIWKVEKTLRTGTSIEEESATAAANVSTRTAKRVITCVTQLKWYHPGGSFKSARQNNFKDCDDVILVCGFSDGTLTSWHRIRGGEEWMEFILLASASDRNENASSSEYLIEEAASNATQGRSFTDVDGFISYEKETNDDKSLSETLYLSVCACSSGGAHYFRFAMNTNFASFGKEHIDGTCSNVELEQLPKYATIKATKHLIRTPSNVVTFNTIITEGIGNPGEDYHVSNSKSNVGVFLIGTAAPRSNKIHVLTVPTHDDDNNTGQQTTPIYSGSLTGHEDWITCFDWTTNIIHHDDGCELGPMNSCCYLASGSQDAKIRLWKWVTVKTTSSERNTANCSENFVPGENNIDNEDEYEEEEIVGEARLEITKRDYNGNYHQSITSVYLEALLIGHEEMVSSVAWHPNPKKLYDQDLILISSSMDRSILLWSSSSGNTESSNIDGQWLPFLRVGSPSGILGGPVGASMLGYLNILVEPEFGRWIIGHAYGGALHFFSCDDGIKNGSIGNIKQNTAKSTEGPVVVQWKAQPCITGHFDEVNDLCWEALTGEYLISVSNDATCRIWAPMNSSLDVWIEIARPQVHGYNLSAVTSLSTINHQHRLVTGADEKELRVFDGTCSFLRMLDLISQRKERKGQVLEDDYITRVDRAYMPSLGLSNKDTAADGADEDTSGASASITLLPLERDLGSISLWPETRKLFGHNSEIARLTSTVSARTCTSTQFKTPFLDQVLVASTTKARDINAAGISIWDVDRNRCLQVLQGGHRSTVTALSFSPDGFYLASSGKDRRLCVWKRHSSDVVNSEQNDLFVLASATNSSHKRIVWSVHFCPYEPNILATGSRDGSTKIWEIVEVDDGGATSVNEYSKFTPRVNAVVGKSDDKPEAVTSLAFSPSKSLDTSKGILAIGLENGYLQLWSVPIITRSRESIMEPPSHVISFDSQFCHIGAVRKLAWRPRSDDDRNCPSILASCSSDNGVRIFSVWI